MKDSGSEQKKMNEKEKQQKRGREEKKISFDFQFIFCSSSSLWTIFCMDWITSVVSDYLKWFSSHSLNDWIHQKMVVVEKKSRRNRREKESDKQKMGKNVFFCIKKLQLQSLINVLLFFPLPTAPQQLQLQLFNCIIIIVIIITITTMPCFNHHNHRDAQQPLTTTLETATLKIGVDAKMMVTYQINSSFDLSSRGHHH